MPDLWSGEREARRRAVAPLAVRVRPRTLEEFAGQRHFLGEGKLLRRMIDADRLTSLVFTGPPGTGKTTLAEVIAAQTERPFVRAHAAAVGVKEIRTILEEATATVEEGGRSTVLFLDEIHRFAKNQQDVLLDAVERGLVTLIGATTENPYFALNSALVSRSTVFRFEPLSEAEVETVLRRAIEDERGFGGLDLRVSDDAIAHWARVSDGDARRALAALEVAVLSQGAGPQKPVVIDRGVAEESIQAKAPVYDRAGDAHYDTISAFIKSMRGGDPDAAVYWLATMLRAGEDPRFIARRIAIFASEDVGLADPTAIRVAAAAWEVAERVGMPECQLTLAQAAIHMAVAPKSKASAEAIWAAMEDVKEGRSVPVPVKIADRRSVRGRSEEEAQKYGGENGAADKKQVPGVANPDYLGVDRVFYVPTDRGLEARIKARLDAAGRENPSEPTAEGSHR